MVKIGMVFGVFDGLHKGHKYFLSQAAKHSGKLIVVVTLPRVVRKLKKCVAKGSLKERIKAVKSFNPKFVVVAGDSKLGEWNVLKTHKPDIVFLGYDQHSLAAELKKLAIEFLFIEPHFPEKYKSNLP